MVTFINSMRPGKVCCLPMQTSRQQTHTLRSGGRRCQRYNVRQASNELTNRHKHLSGCWLLFLFSSVFCRLVRSVHSNELICVRVAVFAPYYICRDWRPRFVCVRLRVYDIPPIYVILYNIYTVQPDVRGVLPTSLSSSSFVVVIQLDNANIECVGTYALCAFERAGRNANSVGNFVHEWYQRCWAISGPKVWLWDYDWIRSDWYGL